MKARIVPSRLSLAACAIFVSVAISGRVAVAAPHSGLVVAAGARCRVLLTKMSYDDPGADDAEFLELYVDRLAAPSPLLDASAGVRGTEAGADAASDGGAALTAITLGDCGLETLDLVNGGGSACETYRSIPLSSVAVPSDGYVTFCAVDSVFAAARCDVMAVGHAALRNGWLQNGPSDGVRFVSKDGAPAVEIAYEGSVECFGAGARNLVAETGQLAQAPEPTDDVNVFCDDHFVLMSPASAPLRGDDQCPETPRAPREDGGSPSIAAHPTVDAGEGGGPWATERAPSTPPRPGSSSSRYGTIGADAGLIAIPRVGSSSPPAAPGCSMLPRPIVHAPNVLFGPLGGFLALALAGRRLTRRMRRTRHSPTTPLRLRRAGSSARFGSGPPR